MLYILKVGVNVGVRTALDFNMRDLFQTDCHCFNYDCDCSVTITLYL